MDGDRENIFERLTDKQKECLELVVARKSSKEIARILKISKPAVDQRITTARNVMGAANRDEAAVIYASIKDANSSNESNAKDDSGTYDRVIYDPVGIPNTGFFPHSSLQEASPSSGLTLDNAIAPYGLRVEQTSDWRDSFLKWLSSDGIIAKRLSLIVATSIGVMVTVLVGLSIAQTLSSLLATS